MYETQKTDYQTDTCSVVGCAAGSASEDSTVADEEFCVLSEKGGDVSTPKETRELRQASLDGNVANVGCNETVALDDDSIDYNIKRFLKSYGSRVDRGDTGSNSEDDTDDDLYNAIQVVRNLLEEYWHLIVCSTKRATIVNAESRGLAEKGLGVKATQMMKRISKHVQKLSKT